MLPVVPGDPAALVARYPEALPAILRSRRAASTGSIPCPASTAAARRCASPAASCWRWTTACTASIRPPASSSFLVHAEPDEPGNRYNDGRCDRRGRLWIGTMDIGIRRASGSFYRIGADRSVLSPVRRHHGAELDRLLAGRPHALFRRHAAARDLGVRFQPPCRNRSANRRVFADLTARKACPTAPASTPKAFSGTPNTAATV